VQKATDDRAREHSMELGEGTKRTLDHHGPSQKSVGRLDTTTANEALAGETLKPSAKGSVDLNYSGPVTQTETVFETTHHTENDAHVRSHLSLSFGLATC
jgi:hypothetical protein